MKSSRAYLVAALIAGAVALAGQFLLRDRANGLSIDVLYRLAHWSGVEHAAPLEDRTIIIAIDEETYRRPPFYDPTTKRSTPQALWTPQVATVLDAVLEGGARVIGLDTIFSTSASAVIPNYDRALYQALRRGGREDRIVLAKAQHQAEPIEPDRGLVIAVGDETDVRAANAIEDHDGVVRRMPLALPGENGLELTFSTELFRRSTGRDLQLTDTGVTIDRHTPPGVVDRALLLDFMPTTQAPTLYSFADLLACAEAGNSDYFATHFTDRTVLIGAVLDVEDRRLTSRRLVKSADGANYAQRCVHPVMAEILGQHRRQLIPGVYLHAAAIDNLKALGGLIEIPTPLRFLCLLTLGLIAAICALCLKLPHTAAALVALLGAWIAIATAAFANLTVLPLVGGTGVVLASAPLTLAYRIGLVDRGRRRLRKAFALYLPEAELDRLTARDELPALGGEVRAVTILFSDIAGYSGLSESLTPAALVADLNRYFARMTEIVQRHGGFVDKFIGDGILAVFGAPLAESRHAEAAVQAGLEMMAALAGGPALTLNGKPIRIRIGLHTDRVIVGNIGAPNRFNYTVVGDGVNLASRLEGVGKAYHVAIIASEDTRRAVGEAHRFRELDRVRVVGRDQPVTLFEPLAPDSKLDLGRFADALALWRRGSFTEAAALFRQLPDDPAAQVFATRAEAWAQQPPAGWDGIVNLQQK
ncbi:adenylate/guanylate cyclase domain-containing protein [Dongia deserti]|uniref:adenylate/guanylate cyclase domain-containing protein n=1 Tax=Dongia deserti TaxID=2268030 RepID=UPI000E6470D7|nr:adenylate/guanylate cyclase domain-containing protein [Dongia deserti]